MMSGLSRAFAKKWGWREKRNFSGVVDIIRDFAVDWENMEKAADAMERIADAQVQWTNAINDLDPQLLTESRQMFDSFAILASTRGVDRIIARFGSSMEEALTRLAEYIMALSEQLAPVGGGGEGEGSETPQGPQSQGPKKFQAPKKTKNPAAQLGQLKGLLSSINSTLKSGIKVTKLPASFNN
jgi:hypothetical protein